MTFGLWALGWGINFFSSFDWPNILLSFSTLLLEVLKELIDLVLKMSDTKFFLFFWGIDWGFDAFTRHPGRHEILEL